MKELKKIDPMSLAKLLGLFGLIIGLILSVLLTAGLSFSEEGFAAFSGWMVILIPIGYGIAYFLTGLISAWIYNFLAKNIGGVKLHF